MIVLRLFKTVNNRKNILAIGNLYKNHLLTKMYIFVYYIKKDKTPSSSRTLKISYIGMKAQEVPIKAGTMKVVLTPDAEVLEEVVVTGMQKMDKRLFTGAATKLSAEGVKLNGMADISRGLEGRAAGVSVQNVSGTFGTAPKIRVRGATSIYGSSKPLWVVDGVIMEDVTEVSARPTFLWRRCNIDFISNCRFELG